MTIHTIIPIFGLAAIGLMGASAFGGSGVALGVPEYGSSAAYDQPDATGVAKPACLNCTYFNTWSTYVWDLEDDRCPISQPWAEETWTTTEYACSNGNYYQCSESEYMPITCNSYEVTNTCPSASCRRTN